MPDPAPLVLSPADNVAILTARAPEGARPLGQGRPLGAPVAAGHKIARADIAEGADVLKFGQVIGYATRPIAVGEHVHVHNCGFGAHDQDYRVGADLAAAQAAIPRVAAAEFLGYRRANGQALYQLFMYDPNGIKIELNYDAAEAGDAKAEVMASDFARN